MVAEGWCGLIIGTTTFSINMSVSFHCVVQINDGPLVVHHNSATEGHSVVNMRETESLLHMG